MSARRPPFLPFLKGAPDFVVGLKPIPAEAQFQPECDEALAEKRSLIQARRGEVYRALPGAQEGERLALARVARAQGEGALGPAGLGDLARAAWAVLDDLVVMSRAEGGWCAEAAVLCAPTFFSAAEAIGKSLDGLHAPVPDRLGPDGSPALGGRIARVFDALQEDVVLERFNWTVQAGPERFTPASAPLKAAARAAAPQSAATLLYLRVERQTIVPLQAGERILFTIRVELDPLTAVLADSAVRAAFAAAWTRAPAHVRAYKGWDAYDHLVSALL
jgi:hypothetical protein